MIANTSQKGSSGPQLRGHSISLAKVKATSDPKKRHTKVICTMGPACWDVKTLEDLIEGGMSVARFNFSHGSFDSHSACLKRVREAAANKSVNLAIMFDSQGPEIRTGFFKDGAKTIDLVKGEQLTLTTDYEFKGDKSKIGCSYKSLAISVEQNQQILVADGSLVLKVLTKDESTGDVECLIENNATIGERKNMNLPGVVVNLPTLTEKDINDIQEWAVKEDVDFIAASFVRKASDITKIREVLGPAGAHIKIIAKIENQEGLDNYEAILALTDGVMVARGDLGMELPLEKIFLAQKFMIRMANVAGKPIVTATELLDSMISNPRPTRAECSDVANAVLDGTDCVMLSGETAGGSFPVNAVNIMARICCEAEGAINFDGLYQAVRNSVLSTYNSMSVSESLASSAVKSALDINARCIVVLSESGTTARLVAKFRPPMPIWCITQRESTARQCSYLKNVTAEKVDSMADSSQVIRTLLDTMKLLGNLEVGDHVVVVQGENEALTGGTSTVKCLKV